ncbi:MAG: hypothetical protein GXY86_07865 [Firmicutes bacterium]|nr:hypothetical protein [Bacillota bacterium]
MDDNKVAILLEDLRAQFRTFGEGLEGLHGEVKEIKKELVNFRNETDQRFLENRQEHQLLIQMVKELDTEVVKMKRVK